MSMKAYGINNAQQHGKLMAAKAAKAAYRPAAAMAAAAKYSACGHQSANQSASIEVAAGVSDNISLAKMAAAWHDVMQYWRLQRSQQLPRHGVAWQCGAASW